MIRRVAFALAVATVVAAPQADAQNQASVSVTRAAEAATAVATHYANLGVWTGTVSEEFYSFQNRRWTVTEHATVDVSTSGGATFLSLPHARARVNCAEPSEFFFLCGNAALTLFTFDVRGPNIRATPKIATKRFSSLLFSFGPNFDVQTVIVLNAKDWPILKISFPSP